MEGLRGRIDADPPVIWDRHGDRWDTGRRALLAYDPSCTHHLVVQDDAVVCRDLVAGAAEAITATPGDVPVGLYMGRTRPRRAMVDRAVREAERKQSPWAVMHGPLWGVAVVIPTRHIPALVGWCDERTSPNYDSRMAEWFRNRFLCWYTVPSLVDHHPDEPSLVPGRTAANRFAHRFIGENASALDVDWHAGKD